MLVSMATSNNNKLRMSILRYIYLKRNQLILLFCVLSATAFLTLEAIYRKRWHCWDKNSVQHYESRGKYVVLYNYVRAKQRFRCEQAVTYCSHADVTTLESVKTVARSYDGPISIAVYCPGRDFLRTAKIISHLRSCFPKVLGLVTFHMVFDTDYFPTGAAVPLFKSYQEEDLCHHDLQRDNISFATQKKLSYPINLLRNAARDASTTYFVLSVDLPLVPSAGLSTKFVRSYKDAASAVFVLPAFTVGENIRMPTDKSTLATILTKGDGDVYQHLECGRCHAVPGMSYAKWLRKGGGSSMGVAFVARGYSGWQPFFVGTALDPRFDERYAFGGPGDRQGQMYSMCSAGYDFLVLDDAYLIYQRGVSEKLSVEPDVYEEYQRRLDKDFLTIFGPNEKCYLPKTGPF